jgi:D-arginine dehydrogenase
VEGNMHHPKVVIIGAGICGAATAYFLARAGATDITVLEAEDAFNRHSSGRSASYFVPMYETRLLALLARTAEPFLQTPPAGFCEAPLLDRRGAILAADESHASLHDQELRMARDLGLQVQELSPE